MVPARSSCSVLTTMKRGLSYWVTSFELVIVILSGPPNSINQVRYFKAREKCAMLDQKSNIYPKMTYVMMGCPRRGRRGPQIHWDRTYSQVSAEDWASKTAWSSWSVCEVFDMLQISRPQVSGIFPQTSAIFPQISTIDLFVKFCKLQRIQELPIHQSLESPKLSWRVCCVGLYRFCTRIVSCCTRGGSRSGRVKIPKEHQKWHIALFLAWQLQKAGFLTYGILFAYKGCSRVTGENLFWSEKMNDLTPWYVWLKQSETNWL